MTRPKKPRKLTKKEMYFELRKLRDMLDHYNDLKLADFVRLRRSLRILMDSDKEIREHKSVNEMYEIIDRSIQLDTFLRQATYSFTGDLLKHLRRIAKEVDEGRLPEQKPHMCEKCGKRPVRFDNYCAPCAELLGIRPHGKVGEET